MNHPTSRLFSILGILLLIIVVVLGLGWLRVYLMGDGNASVWPTSVVDTYREENFEQALANRASIQVDTSKTEEEKAMAVFNSLGAEYKITGDISSILKDIQDMKTIILNEKLTPVLRAETLDVLAKEYAITGRNPAVFAEIYKDAPFSDYLAPGDPELSSRRLAEWSYEILPNTNAAIMVANWYTSQLVQKPDLPKATKDQYVASATEYLRKADAALIEESKASGTYLQSRRYMYYMFYRTVVTGQLANYNDDLKKTYREAYEKFFEVAQTQNNSVAAEFELFAHLAYAQQLNRDGDTAAAKEQLDMLATKLSAVTPENAKTNGFFNTMKNERANNPAGARWTGVLKMAALSSKFKAAMGTVTGSQI